MIEIKKFIVNLFQENTYLLYDETKEAIVFDAGFQSEEEQLNFKTFLLENELKLVGAYNTHSHIDHVLGNQFILEEFGLQAKGHKADEFLIEGALAHAAGYGMQVEQPPMLGGYITDKDVIKFGKSELTILHVPGHSPGSLAFYNETQKIVFVGDVLFADSIGRTDLPQGDYDVLITSIFTKLLTMPDDTTVFSGHGPETSIGVERRSNPFLMG